MGPYVNQQYLKSDGGPDETVTVPINPLEGYCSKFNSSFMIDAGDHELTLIPEKNAQLTTAEWPLMNRQPEGLSQIYIQNGNLTFETLIRRNIKARHGGWLFAHRQASDR